MRKRRGGIGTIYRRAGSAVYWVQYTTAAGERVRESSNETDEVRAREFLRRQIIAGDGRGRTEGRTMTDLPDLLVATYRNEHDPAPARLRRYAASIRQHYAHLIAFFGTLDLRKIDRERIEAYIEHRRGPTSRRPDGAKAATIRHEVADLSRGLMLALGRRPQLPMIGVRNRRMGFLTSAQLASLLPHLQPYMRAFTEAAYITGWRRGELRDLRWTQVDWTRGVIRLEPGTTKNDDGREFPFVAHPRLEELLQEQRARTTELERLTGTLCPWVFHRDGHRVAWYYDGWQTACERARLPGRLFHDLRRSAVRNLIDAGVPQSTAMTITGHRTASVFRRYEIRDAADVASAVTKLAAFHAAITPLEPARVSAIASTDARTDDEVEATDRGTSGRRWHSPRHSGPVNIGENAEPRSFESRWGRSDPLHDVTPSAPNNDLAQPDDGIEEGK